MLFLKYIVAFFQKMGVQRLKVLGKYIGKMVYYLSKERRQVAHKNLSLVFDGVVPEGLTKKTFENNFISFLEIFLVRDIDEGFLEYVDLPDMGELFRLIEEKRNIFLISGHIGSWEFLPKIYTMISKNSITVVGKSLRSEKLNKIVEALRYCEKINYINHFNALISIQRAFKKNMAVGALLDQGGLEKNSFFVEFFGLKTTFVSGIPIYAVRSNAVIVMAFLLRQKDRWRLEIYPALFPDKSLSEIESAKKLAKSINEVYEDVIKKYPEQWLAMNKRFKRVLESEDGQACSIY
ncbi:MAG: lysophospholipid acyltransferase family protein [Calditerrivibrio sp.]|nr:lysophospholipid acyltransferase family protein [Calditerrivibrio sp.]